MKLKKNSDDSPVSQSTVHALFYEIMIYNIAQKCNGHK